MKQNILHKAVLFLMLLVAGNAYAGGTSYYTKAIAKAVGSGKVYVSTSSDAPADTDYKESESSAELSDASQSRTDSYKLYAKSTTGYAFDGWYTD